MSRFRSLSVVVAAVALLTSPAVTASAATAPTRPDAPPSYDSRPSYVALGDSYASGTGAGGYAQDGTTCDRSRYGYPSLIAVTRGYSLDLQACSGATTREVRDDQLATLDSDTDLVTVTAGGNDVQFSTVIAACGFGASDQDCFAGIDQARAYIRDALGAELRGLYTDIRARAPRATVTVVGYPRLFNGQNCNPATSFTAPEMAALNRTGDQLGAVTARAARDAGFRFVDVTPAFDGHAVCDPKPWLNGATDGQTQPLTDSFHPNRIGYLAGYYIPVVASLSHGARS